MLDQKAIKHTVLAHLSLNNSLVFASCQSNLKLKINYTDCTRRPTLHVHTGPTQFKTILADEHIAFSDDSSLTSATITPTSLTSQPRDQQTQKQFKLILKHDSTPNITVRFILLLKTDFYKLFISFETLFILQHSANCDNNSGTDLGRCKGFSRTPKIKMKKLRHDKTLTWPQNTGNPISQGLKLFRGWRPLDPPRQGTTFGDPYL